MAQLAEPRPSDDAETAPRPGGERLRARRRARLEAEVEETALELFAERGFEAVTVDEIADAAAISRRTFFRYFGSKEELVLRDVRRRVEWFIDALRARPADEDVLVAVRVAAMTAAATYEADRESVLRLERIIASAPGVLARTAAEPTALLDEIIGLIAERLGTDPTVDLRPAIIATTVVNASHVALGMWLTTPGSNYPALSSRALDLVVAGLQATVDAPPVVA